MYDHTPIPAYLMTAKEAAVRLSVSDEHVWTWAKRGVLERVQVYAPGAKRAKRLVTVESVEALVAQYAASYDGETRPQPARDGGE